MPLFRKKPVVIEAVRWTVDNLDEVLALASTHADLLRKDFTAAGGGVILGGALIIPTLEGDHQANPGDWIIKGVKGEIYPCKPDIFEATYEAA